jgi:hypothetical protein
LVHAIASFVKHIKTNEKNLFINEISKDLSENFLQANEKHFVIEIENFELSQYFHERKKFFSVIFIDQLETILELETFITQEKFHFNGIFTIILNQKLENESENIFKLFWTKFIFNVNILMRIESLEIVSFLTFLPFNGKSCGDTKPIKINEFDGQTLTWKNENFLPKKFKNLQKCVIKAGAFKVAPLVIIETINGEETFSGIAVDLLHGLHQP